MQEIIHLTKIGLVTLPIGSICPVCGKHKIHTYFLFSPTWTGYEQECPKCLTVFIVQGHKDFPIIDMARFMLELGIDGFKVGEMLDKKFGRED